LQRHTVIFQRIAFALNLIQLAFHRHVGEIAREHRQFPGDAITRCHWRQSSVSPSFVITRLAIASGLTPDCVADLSTASILPDRLALAFSPRRYNFYFGASGKRQNTPTIANFFIIHPACEENGIVALKA
jgi:hypothetical protein